MLMNEQGIPPHKILVVDDDEDVHRVTRIALRSLTYQQRGVELISAHTAAEALGILSTTPDIGVVLLDVVMESTDAGLAACRSIRGELGNELVRILLRTGQPGTAPEKTVVEEYDIDGYLPKGELTSTRLVTMVRTALKAYTELKAMGEKYRNLESAHESVRDLPHTTSWTCLS